MLEHKVKLDFSVYGWLLGDGVLKEQGSCFYNGSPQASEGHDLNTCRNMLFDASQCKRNRDLGGDNEWRNSKKAALNQLW